MEGMKGQFSPIHTCFSCIDPHFSSTPESLQTPPLGGQAPSALHENIGMYVLC